MAFKTEQRQRHRCQREKQHQHRARVEAVGKPAAANRADDAADIQKQQKHQAGAEAVARHGHQLGQPRAQTIHHQQAHKKRLKKHQGAQSAVVAEQSRERLLGFLRLVHRQFGIIGQGLAGERGQHFARLGYFALAHQKSHRIGQLRPNQRQQQERNHRQIKHHLPAELRHNPNAQHRREHAADSITAKHHRHQRAADAAGRIFAHQRHHIGHHPAYAQPGNKAHHTELQRRLRKAVERGKAAEEHNAQHNHFLAPEAVGKRAQQHRAYHHAE